MEFSGWLREQMVERRLSQYEAASLIGVSHTTVGRWLKGKRPGLVACDKIAKAFRKDVEVVWRAAGHPVSSDIPSINDAQANIISLVRRIDWSVPERVRIATGTLNGMLPDE